MPFSLLPILPRFWNQSVLTEDRIYLLAGTGVELCQYADVLFSVATIDTVSVTDLVFCHIHLSFLLQTKKARI